MIYNRRKLFDGLRKHFGKFDQTQVTVIGAIVDEWEKRGLSDDRWLSYMLATGWGECQWRPIAEIGKGKGKPYGNLVKGKRYYGRGLVQLTWQRNYDVMGKLLNLDLVGNPDLALQVPVAVKIMFEGMICGLFTGKALHHYFNATKDSSINARRIVNGTDKALAFARWHGLILAVLRDAKLSAAKTVEFDAPAPVEPVLPPPIVDLSDVVEPAPKLEPAMARDVLIILGFFACAGLAVATGMVLFIRFFGG